MTTVLEGRLPRRGTAAAWTSANPTLAQGELGRETDTGKSKRGDGSTPWNSLGYLLSHYDLDDLADVTITSGTEDDVVQLKSGVWVNRTVAQLLADGSIGDLSDVDTATAAPTVGDALTYDGADWVPDGETHLKSDDFPISVPAMDLEVALNATKGNLASGATGTTVIHLADDVSAAWVIGTVALPWTSVDVEVVWASRIATPGDVVFRFYADSLTAGDDIRVQSQIPGDVTATSGAQFAAVYTTIASGITHDPTETFQFVLSRRANELADTLDGDASVVAVRFSKGA